MKIQNIFPKPFSKYDFVKSYSATAKTPKLKKEKEREAVLVADAIKNTEENLISYLVTKEDLEIVEKKLEAKIEKLEIKIEKDLAVLSKDLTMKMIVVVGSLLAIFTALQKFIS